MYTSHHSRSDSSSSSKQLKNVSQELKLLQLWKQQEIIQKDKEKIERDAHLAILEKERRISKKEGENRLALLGKELRKIKNRYEKLGQKENSHRYEEHSHRRKIYKPH